jgi:RHS repeat-associated protein
VRLVVSSTGTVAQRIDYDEWGVATDSNPGFQPFGFAGGMQDPTTGLVHFGARDYAPALGRWTTRDPSGFGGGRNLYGCAGGDPIDFIDATGAHPVVIAVATGASVFFAATMREALWTAAGAFVAPVIAKGLGIVAGEVAGAVCSAVSREAPLFPNLLPQHLARELSHAAALGVSPKVATLSTLEGMAGQRIKWVVTEGGELIVAPHSPFMNQEISHAVLSNGNPVRAAGEVFLTSTPSGLQGDFISSYSGHFFDGKSAEAAAALAQGETLFGDLGISFGQRIVP